MKKLAAGFVAIAVLAALVVFTRMERSAPPPLAESAASVPGLDGDVEAGADADRGVNATSGTAVLSGTVLRSGRPAAAAVEVRRIGGVSRPGVAGPGYDYDDLLARITGSTPTAEVSVPAGADGHFEVASLRPGVYEVRATAADGVRGSARVWIRLDGVRVEAVVPLFGGTLSLAGQAVHADGTPFTGRVALFLAGHAGEVMAYRRCAGSVPVDETGRFQFAGLAPGPVVLVAAGPGNLLHTSAVIELPHLGEFTFELGPGDGPLTGIVVRDADGLPIAGARVTVTGDGLRQWAVTDDDGKFSVPLRRPGLAVTAAAAGCLSRTCETDGSDGPVTVRLFPCAVVRGRVTDRDTGTPVAGIDVFAKEINRAISSDAHGITDRDGRYEILTAPAGDVIVFAQGGGRVSPELAGASFRGFNPLVVRVAPGEAATADLVVVAAARAVGAVLDATGLGLPGVAVYARDGSQRERMGFRPDLQAAVTDAEGRFALEGLVPGVPYRFEVTDAPGLFPRNESDPAHGLIRPEPGETVEVELRAMPSRQVTVRVVDEGNGAPIAGAMVSCTWTGGLASSEFPTAADGTAVLPRVATSEGSIQVKHASLVPAPPVVLPAGTDDRTVEVLRRVNGKLARGVGLREGPDREPEDQLLVRVVDPDGRPVPRAALWCDQYGALSSLTGGDPDSVIDGIGRHGVLADTQEIHLLVARAESAPGRPLGLGCVYVGPLAGSTREVLVRLPEEAMISGVVRGPDGRGMRGIRVWARGADHGRASSEPVSTGYSSRDGSFLLRGLGTGEYEIGADVPDDVLPVSALRVPAGTTGLQFDLKRAVCPELLIEDDQGRPLAGANVAVSQLEGQWRTGDSAWTDERGRVRLRHLDPDARYQLRATAPWEHKELRLPPIIGWIPEDGTFRFERELHISGKVVDEAGKPVEGASVRIRMGEQIQGTVGPTDAYGSFDIGQLLPGEALLRVLPPGAHRREWESPWTPVVAGSRDVVLTTSLGRTIAGSVPGWTGGDRRITLARLHHEKASYFHRSGEIAADGSFRFTGLPEGAEYALFVPPDDRGFSAFRTGVPAGESRVGLALEPGRTITGRLRYPEGGTYPSVKACRMDLGIAVTAVLDPEGRFSINGLPNLEFEVAASVAMAGSFLQGSVSARPGESVEIVLEAGPGK